MKIVKTVDRELTEKEVESIKKFRSYTDGVSFACLKENVMIIIEEEERCRDAEILREKAKDAMKYALSIMPDFTSYDMDDGCVLVCTDGGAFAFTEKAVRKEENNIGLLLELRGRALEACEEGNIIAIAYEEE